MGSKVPGMLVPNDIIERMRSAQDPKKEGMKICIETIEHIRSIKGVHGIHIMPVTWEDKVPEIVEQAGLFPRP